MFTSCGYNDLVKLDEGADSQWANVENAYKRRADLVPNLVKTVQGAADFEKETLESVIEARAKATSTTIDPSNASPEQIQQFLSAQDGLSSALGKLMVVVERYPELKANANFLDLQSQLEGTENRISTERNRFNGAVKDYNSYRREFPQVIYSGIMGFKDKSYFEATDADMENPEVEFDFGSDDD